MNFLTTLAAYIKLINLTGLIKQLNYTAQTKNIIIKNKLVILYLKLCLLKVV